MALNPTSGNDHTMNKVAVCSAIFAGFAYVGYSVARNAFGRRSSRRNDDGYQHEDHRLYFRRLSQTTQTDVLLGNLDGSDAAGRVFLRPMNVQQRIKELNLRARMFADTMMAIQTPSNKHSLYGPRSLQASPWNSPRIMSPVGVGHLLGSRSTENLLLCDNPDLESNFGTPLRRKVSNRSLRRKSPQPSEHRLSISQNQDMEEFEKLNHPSLLNRPMEPNEAKNLLKLMGSRDVQVLEKVLVTVSNLATFTPNQEVMRESGYLNQLQQLIYHPEESVQITSLVALGNLALNKDNSKNMKEIIPMVLTLMKMMDSDDIIYNCLTTLTNIAVFQMWHSEMQSSIHFLFALLENRNKKIVLQCLKLLINLSCNDNMVPHLLGGKAPKKLLSMLNLNENEDILLRVVTLFSNLTDAVKAMELDPVLDLPIEEKAPSPDTILFSRYANIYGVNMVDKIRTKSLVLMKQHKNEEIRLRAQKIYTILSDN